MKMSGKSRSAEREIHFDFDPWQRIMVDFLSLTAMVGSDSPRLHTAGIRLLKCVSLTDSTNKT